MSHRLVNQLAFSIRHPSGFVVAALASLLALAPATGAQQSTASASTAPSALTAAMRPMTFLLGEWEGTGWIRTGAGAPSTFRQRETVRPAAGGSVVVIDGKGVSTVAGQEGRVVHEAFAVVSHDSTSSTYRWHAYRAAGPELDVVPEFGTDRLVWGFPAPGGAIRFTIVKTPAGAWNEIGEFVREGAAPAKFFEMTLTRRPVAAREPGSGAATAP